MEENTNTQQFGILAGADTTAQPAQTAPADQTATITNGTDTAVAAAPTTDPALYQYRQMIDTKGETGRLTGQIKEVEVGGQPVILVHPGLKTAMGIIANSTTGVPVIFDEPYATDLITKVVRYPKDMQAGGLDYFDEHPDLLRGVLTEADKFLGKFVYTD